ncbi:MAG: biopolymer transporter ExbD [Phycisphaerae bacterium]|nr:biopolymer transporter ExbD [Phycisphaerae bacterium]
MPSLREQPDLSIHRRVLGRLHQSRSGGGLGLRMTAMIDVIFLLLIFFVLTAQFSREEQYLPIRLPGPASAAQRLDIPAEPLRISIAMQGGQCRIDLGRGRQIALTEPELSAGLEVFSRTVTTALEQERRIVTDPVEIACSDSVPWEILVKVYNGLYAMGIEDITFILE